MTCRSVCAKLAKYQDGDLPETQRLAVEEHLRRCEACAREWVQLRGVVALLEGLTVAEPSEAFTAGVLRAVKQETIAEPVRPLASPGLVLAGVGLILSTVIVAGLAGWGPLDLSGWGIGLTSLLTAAAKLCAALADVSGPVVGALVEGLGRPVAWFLVADVVALVAILTAGRRLVSAKTLRNMTNILAM